MRIREFFPTLVYTAALQKSGAREFNRQLLKECRQIREDDAGGRRWSARNYPGGYTSYASAHRLQSVSPTFETLQRRLQRHVDAFAAISRSSRGSSNLMPEDSPSGPGRNRCRSRSTAGCRCRPCTVRRGMMLTQQSVIDKARPSTSHSTAAANASTCRWSLRRKVSKVGATLCSR